MATITEDYVSFETAKLLKEKGFDESTSMVYMSYGDLCKLNRYNSICNSDYNDITKNYFEYTAPTLQMAMKWLREVHNIDIFPWKIGKGIYSCAIFNSNTGQDLSSDKDFPSEKYEETVNAAIKYCLENLI